MMEHFWKVAVTTTCLLFHWKYLKINLRQPEEFCINQLLAIAHKIYKFFDDGWEMGGEYKVFSLTYQKRLIKPAFKVLY